MIRRYLQFLLFVLYFGSATLTAGGFGAGSMAAVKKYGLSELVAAAKRSDPDSNIPYAIEHMLTGLSMATDPTATMEAVYPGALAASAISQLIDMHGKDIANMMYSDRKVFIGGASGDPSLIPGKTATVGAGRVDALCREMFNVDGGGVADCERYISHIHRCNANTRPTDLEIEHCNAYLSEFYEHMRFEGKNKLVREAGNIAAREFASIEKQPVCNCNVGTNFSYYSATGKKCLMYAPDPRLYRCKEP